MLRHLFTLILLVATVCGFQWSDRLRQDRGPLEVCSGDNIQLLWNFTLDKGERVKAMVWGCQPEGKQEDILATFVDSHFVPMSSYSGRLAHLRDGGLELSCATILESGNYSIAVSTEGANNVLTVNRKTVSVTVMDTPKTLNGEIQTNRKVEAVRDDISGDLHIELTCGNFSDRGHPPVDVIWTTPRGHHLSSRGFEDGFFSLLVPNPPVGGNYCCSIPPALPAAKCLADDSPLLETVCVEVEEVEARFFLLEARYAMMEARQHDLGTVVLSMGNRTDALVEKIDDAARKAYPVHFHARLTSDVSLSTGSVLKLTGVLSNERGAYDPKTGYFTAPVNGSYVFIATTGPTSSSKWSNMDLLKEGVMVARTYEYMDSNSDMGTCHAALSLTAGERVWLQSSSTSSINYFNGVSTYFTGFRLT